MAFKRSNGLSPSTSRDPQRAHRAPQLANAFFRDSTAPQAHDVHRAHARSVALHNDEGRYVSLAGGGRGDECALADTHVLGDAAQSTEGHPVFDDRMTREL